jgi:hypothetical protein
MEGEEGDGICMKQSSSGISDCEVMDVKGLASFLGVSTAWVYQHKNEWPHRWVGNLHFFTRSAVLEHFGRKIEDSQIPTKTRFSANAEKIAMKLLQEDT